MKPVDSSVARFTEDGLRLIIGNRVYGDSTPKATLPIPEEMKPLGEALRKDSKLLTLSPESEARALYDAYGADLMLLERYREGFHTAIHAAVYARIVSGGEVAKEFLDELTRQIAEIVHAPTLSLDPEAARLPVNELRLKLQKELQLWQVLRQQLQKILFP